MIPATNDKSSYSSTWEAIRSKQHVVMWWKSLWFSGFVPKHAFILTIKERLVRNERWVFLSRYRIESRDHLYFECLNSNTQKLEVDTFEVFDYRQIQDQDYQLSYWIINRLKGASLRSRFCKVAW